MDHLNAHPEGDVVLSHDMGFRGQGVAQGGIVDTPDGRWYAFMFQDRGASGRMPVLMPMHWEHGRPVLGDHGRVPTEVCNLVTVPGIDIPPISHGDSFENGELSLAWQWNHIPRMSNVRMGYGSLRLTSDTVTDCLTNVPNVLTMRAPQPICQVQVTVNGAEMKPGDAAGLCAFQSQWAFVALSRLDDGYAVEAYVRTADDPENGRLICRIPWHETVARLKVIMDFTDMKDLASLWVER